MKRPALPGLVIAGVVLILMLLAVSLVLRDTWLRHKDQPGDVSSALVTLGESDTFTREELEQAAALVETDFSQFTNCVLQRLWYDEAECGEVLAAWREENHVTDNGWELALLGDFRTGDRAGADTDYPYRDLLSNRTNYYRFAWIIHRDGVNLYIFDHRRGQTQYMPKGDTTPTPTPTPTQ